MGISVHDPIWADTNRISFATYVCWLYASVLMRKYQTTSVGTCQANISGSSDLVQQLSLFLPRVLISACCGRLQMEKGTASRYQNGSILSWVPSPPHVFAEAFPWCSQRSPQNLRYNCSQPTWQPTWPWSIISTTSRVDQFRDIYPQRMDQSSYHFCAANSRRCLRACLS